jgi:hypothetical protein
MNLNDMYGRIAEYIKAHDSDTYGQIAASLRLSRSQVSRIARRLGIKRAPGKRSAALKAAVAVIDATMPQSGAAPTGEAASPPAVKPISIESDAPLAGETLSVTADTALVETAVL